MAAPSPLPFVPFAAGGSGSATFAGRGRAPAPSFDYADAGSPEAGLVLEHLSRVGVYEPGGGAAPAWENPARQKARGTWAISVAIVLIAAAGAGSYAYSKKIRTERMQHALALNDEVKKLLETGSVVRPA